ncbi:MAG: hypothetical protein FJ387_11740 [Verrucomicrobia bacterium]|nr:hypothetical protein [Verrucomicrobiota bacterium]
MISDARPADSGDYAAIASNADGISRSRSANVIVFTNQPCNFPWVWMQCTNEGAFSAVQGSTIDNDENVYVTGFFYAQSSGLDYITMKLDRRGEILWKSTFGDSSRDDDRPAAIAVDALGNCYVTGASYSIKQGAGGDNDYLTVKYGSGGELLWSARYSSSTVPSYDESWAMALDSAGDVYVSGNRGTLKYDTAGAASAR